MRIWQILLLATALASCMASQGGGPPKSPGNGSGGSPPSSQSPPPEEDRNNLIPEQDLITEDDNETNSITPEPTIHEDSPPIQPDTVSSTLFTCKSENGGYNECPYDFKDVLIVQVSKQLTEQPCLENQTFGFTENGLWVNYGCSAHFEVISKPESQDEQNYYYVDKLKVKCSSKNGIYKECLLPDKPNKIEILKEYSKNKCDFNKSFGIIRRSVWVDESCRARFEVFFDHKIFYKKIRQLKIFQVQCQSYNGNLNKCKLDYNIKQIQLLEHSSRECVLDTTFGFKNKTIWVDSNCKANFLVEAFPKGPRWINTCESKHDKHTCIIPKTWELEKFMPTINNPYCIENQTYEVNDNEITVSNACKITYVLREILNESDVISSNKPLKEIIKE